VARVNRWHVKRLEQAARGEMVEIPQKDGSVKRFPSSAVQDAYLSAYALALGQAKPVDEHPMLDALRNSSDPQWRTMWDDLLEVARDDPAEDLSES